MRRSIILMNLAFTAAKSSRKAKLLLIWARAVASPNAANTAI